ncbi:unnamed protein product [Cylindrotheca closterium]|uniref:Uncharacterized protein n=1 Tax=Cylindrotheca closterium TaxID=2856 RepID=A0AAD2CUT2_9STRA|nr:unnamed protein product [Cylindrotheca closterium]
MKAGISVSIFTLLTSFLSSDVSAQLPSQDDEQNLSTLLHSKTQACNENGMVSAWCDSSMSAVECLIHPESNVYACMCTDPSSCPDECIETTDGDENSRLVKKSHHGIMCHGIPQDEPNYVLKHSADQLPSLHHCENNALVANWCNEVDFPGVSCLVLPALDEYVCTCIGRTAACPSECVNGETADRKTHNAIRCRGIPVDSPNYILE